MLTNYFHTIDTENKAYWLGFLYADGCVDKRLNHVILDLSVKDMSHLEKFCRDIEITKPIKIHGDRNSYCRVTVSSVEMCRDLYNCGCVPAKSLILKFPSNDIVPEELMNHFIRGYFDGDGCVCLCKSTRKSRKKIPTDERFSMNKWFFKLLGTEDMLKHIQHYLPDHISLTTEGKVKRLKCGGTQKVYGTLRYLYMDATIYLERKHEKFLELQKCIYS